jgi:hypothetical protein
MKKPSGLVSIEGSLSGSAFSLWTHRTFPSAFTLLVSLLPIIRIAGRLDYGPTIMTLFNLNYPHIQSSYGGLGFPKTNFREAYNSVHKGTQS